MQESDENNSKYKPSIEADKSDLFDVLEYISFATMPITREDGVAEAQASIFYGLDDKQKEFIQFVLSKYIETGADAVEHLGGVSKIQRTFTAFQKHLYQRKIV